MALALLLCRTDRQKLLSSTTYILSGLDTVLKSIALICVVGDNVKDIKYAIKQICKFYANYHNYLSPPLSRPLKGSLPNRIHPCWISYSAKTDNFSFCRQRQSQYHKIYHQINLQNLWRC